MKKAMALLLALVMCLSLAACVSFVDGELTAPADVNVGNSGNGEPAQSDGKKATVEETVLVDEGGVKITAKSLETDGIFGTELKLLIENNSGKDLTVQCQNASVNGYMVETLMSVDVVDGKKANDSITFLSSDLEACGITSIADMAFSFHMFTTADWETYLDTAQIQLKTSLADSYAYTYDDSGEVAYESGGIKIVIKGLSEDSSLLGPGVVVYMENNTEKGVTVQTRDVSVNGFMVEALFSCDIMPGKRAVSTITFLETELEENGITDIEDVELSFHIVDLESWNPIADTDVVSISYK